MKLEILGQVFDKYAIIKFHENPSGGDRVVLCGKKDGRTDVTKLTVAVRKFANAPKKKKHFHSICVQLEATCCPSMSSVQSFLVTNATALIKFELLQWPWGSVAGKHRIQTAVKNFIFCLPRILVQLWVNDQLDAQLRYRIVYYYNNIHVSSKSVLIIRRSNCINTASGIVFAVSDRRCLHWTVTHREHCTRFRRVLIQFGLLMMSTDLLETCRVL